MKVHAVAAGTKVLFVNEVHNNRLKNHLRRDFGNDGDGEAIRPYYLIVYDSMVKDEGLTITVLWEVTNDKCQL